jgi:hypothetical protein
MSYVPEDTTLLVRSLLLSSSAYPVTLGIDTQHRITEECELRSGRCENLTSASSVTWSSVQGAQGDAPYRVVTSKRSSRLLQADKFCFSA